MPVNFNVNVAIQSVLVQHFKFLNKSRTVEQFTAHDFDLITEEPDLITEDLITEVTAV